MHRLSFSSTSFSLSAWMKWFPSVSYQLNTCLARSTSESGVTSFLHHEKSTAEVKKMVTILYKPLGARQDLNADRGVTISRVYPSLLMMTDIHILHLSLGPLLNPIIISYLIICYSSRYQSFLTKFITQCHQCTAPKTHKDLLPT